MNFKEFSQKSFRQLAGTPNSTFSNISFNNNAFTSKANIMLNIPFEEYRDKVFKRFSNLHNQNSEDFKIIYGYLDGVTYRGNGGADVYNDDTFVDTKKQAKSFYAKTNVASNCFFYKSSGGSYNFSISVEFKATLIEKDAETGKDIIRIMCKMIVLQNKEY